MPVAINLPTSKPSTVVDDMDVVEPRWFAIKVGHRKEKVVVRQLEREGIECFLPLRDKPYRYASKTGVRQIPLLGGYLFVRLVLQDCIAVQRTNFVYGFVKIGRERRQIKLAELDLLRRLCSEDSLKWVAEEKIEALEPGELVEICRGALTGVKGYYIGAKSTKKFIITFEGLDARLMTCEVSPDDVVPLRK